MLGRGILACRTGASLSRGANVVIFVNPANRLARNSRRTPPLARLRTLTKKISSRSSRAIPSDTWLMRSEELKRL
jgi:hypothetical protein